MKNKLFSVLLLFTLIFSISILQADVVHRFSAALYKDMNRDEFAFYVKYLPDINQDIITLNTVIMDVFAAYDLDYRILKKQKAVGEIDGNIHRLGFRATNDKFEFVLGKQKINFGEAQVLRVINWYDTVDYFDISSYTQGTWSILTKFYPDWESALWGWYNKTNTHESDSDFEFNKIEECDFGFRYERDFSKFSSGLSFEKIGRDSSIQGRYKGRKFAFDLKVDTYIGLWTEMQRYTVEKSDMFEEARQNTCVMTGADYTFPIGNGLYTMTEYRLSSDFQKKASDFCKSSEDVCLVLDYPISIMYSNMFSAIYHTSEIKDMLPEFTMLYSVKYTKDLYIINLQTILSYSQFDEKPELGIQLSFLADF